MFLVKVTFNVVTRSLKKMGYDVTPSEPITDEISSSQSTSLTTLLAQQ